MKIILRMDITKDSNTIQFFKKESVSYREGKKERNAKSIRLVHRISFSSEWTFLLADTRPELKGRELIRRV